MVLMILSASEAYPQNTSWVNITTFGTPQSIAYAGNYLWIGTTNGLRRFNKTTGETAYYNVTNSGLPDNGVLSVAVDKSSNVWAGTQYGVSEYDGTHWTTYTTMNSNLPWNYVSAIVADGSGNVWIGTRMGL